MHRPLVALTLACLALHPTAASAAPKRWNLVAIVTDDQARWAVGAYGNKECRTPHQDRLAREGALFLNAFVPTPVCSPSRVSYLTGKYGTQVGITDYINPQEARAGIGLPAGTLTWPAVLQKAGYTTGLIGKWHLGIQPHQHPTRLGFSHFYGSLHGSFLVRNPLLEVSGKEAKVKGQAVDLITDEALRFLDTNKARPFALLVHYREPHAPYGPMKEEDQAPFRKLDPTIPRFPGMDFDQVKGWTRDYYAAVHAIDRNLGRILAHLRTLGILDNTIVLFTSDHGYMLGHHGLRHKGNAHWYVGGVRGPKRPNMFEESIRVPLLIRWPRVVRPGTRIEEMVTNLDTFPSVLGMLGVPVPAGARHHGADFTPLLQGKKVPWRDTLYGQYDLHNVGLAYMRMIRTRDWKLVRHYRSNGLDELYQLSADPGEMRNLYTNAKHTAVREGLQKRLTTWMRSLDDHLLRDEKGAKR